VRSLYAAFQQVSDGRGRRGRRYEVAVVLTLLLLGKLAGEQTMAGIAEWVRERQSLLRQWLPLPRTPCANTYRYVCAHVDAQELFAAVAAVLSSPALAQPTPPNGSAPPPLRQLACDGKEIRGSQRLTATGVQAAQGLLGIYDTASDRMQAMLPIEGKGFEPKALRTWLAEQARQGQLAGCLLTADALHTQRTVCKAIRAAGADYLFVVKRNQRSLREDIDYLFSQKPDFWFPERSARQVDVGHGRLELRTLRASDELNRYLADRWPGVQQVFQIKRTVTRNSRQGVKVSDQMVYGLTSVPASQAPPQLLLAWLRAHWRIENRSHWRRDATLGEDRLQLTCKPAALVLAVLNCTILALLDRIHVTNCRQALRRFNAHPEQALALICQPL
jgi:predicted transposase YbfD/YdcC